MQNQRPPRPPLPTILAEPPQSPEPKGHIKFNDMTTNPFGRSPIKDHTNGIYFSNGEDEQLDCQKDIPIAHVFPIQKSPTPSSRSSNSPFQSPTLARAEVLQFNFRADPSVDIKYKDVLDYTRALNLPDLEVAPDFDLPENFDEVTILK